MLDLVGADLGIALVPATAALLAARGVTLRRLRQRPRGDVLALLQRRHDSRTIMKSLAQVADEIFSGMRPRLTPLV